MFCMIREVLFSPELILSVEEDWEYLAFAWNTCYCFLCLVYCWSYKVLNGFTEIHYKRMQTSNSNQKCCYLHYPGKKPLGLLLNFTINHNTLWLNTKDHDKHWLMKPSHVLSSHIVTYAFGHGSQVWLTCLIVKCEK